MAGPQGQLQMQTDVFCTSAGQKGKMEGDEERKQTHWMRRGGGGGGALSSKLVMAPRRWQKWVGIGPASRH